jgi:hypothetical protein
VLNNWSLWSHTLLSVCQYLAGIGAPCACFVGLQGSFLCDVSNNALLRRDKAPPGSTNWRHSGFMNDVGVKQPVCFWNTTKFETANVDNSLVYYQNFSPKVFLYCHAIEWLTIWLIVCLYISWLHLTNYYYTQTSVVSHIARYRFSTADVPLLPGSRPCRLETISRQPHTLAADWLVHLAFLCKASARTA